MIIPEAHAKDLDLIGIGEAMVEFWSDGPLGRATALNRTYGGDVLNTLVTAARLGNAVGFLSKVGDDPFGAGMTSDWRQEGIDLSNCPLVPGVNGVYFIGVRDDGERDFSYNRLGSAASTLSVDDLDEQYLARARVIYLSGVTQAISEECEAATLEAARIAKASGALVAFDPNFRSALWARRASGVDVNEGLRLARRAIEQLMPYIDILLPSFPGDAELWDAPADANLADACLAGGIALLGMKLGAAGSDVSHAGRLVRVEGEAVASVVDTTGAGDAWNAAFLHALLAGSDPVEAARYGNKVAAWKLRYRGAIPPIGARPPTLDADPARSTDDTRS